MVDASLLKLLDNISDQITTVARSNEQLSTRVTDIQSKQSAMSEKLSVVETNTVTLQDLKHDMSEAVQRIEGLEEAEEGREEHRKHRVALGYKVAGGILLAAVLYWLGFKS